MAHIHTTHRTGSHGHRDNADNVRVRALVLSALAQQRSRPFARTIDASRPACMAMVPASEPSRRRRTAALWRGRAPLDSASAERFCERTIPISAAAVHPAAAKVARAEVARLEAARSAAARLQLDFSSRDQQQSRPEVAAITHSSSHRSMAWLIPNGRPRRSGRAARAVCAMIVLHTRCATVRFGAVSGGESSSEVVHGRHCL